MYKNNFVTRVALLTRGLDTLATCARYSTTEGYEFGIYCGAMMKAYS